MLLGLMGCGLDEFKLVGFLVGFWLLVFGLSGFECLVFGVWVGYKIEFKSKGSELTRLEGLLGCCAFEELAGDKDPKG